MSKNVNIRDLLEKADRSLYEKRSNDPECPLFQFLPKETNMRYNLRNTSISDPRIYTDRFKNAFSNRIIFRYDMSLYCFKYNNSEDARFSRGFTGTITHS